jgi:putative phage-type endonuclease
MPHQSTSHATVVPALAPGSPEWMLTMSASKIAAVLGLSDYDSPRSLWNKMAGTDPGTGETDVTRRGHYLEPAIRAWFTDQHPDWTVDDGGMHAHPDLPWATATPDGHVTLPDGTLELLECKSFQKTGDFGAPGTDEIPMAYRVQVMWQMFVTGARRCHVATIGPWLDFATYVVDYDEADAALLLREATAFMDSLPTGTHPQRPPADGHRETLPSIRRSLGPMEDETVEVAKSVAQAYLVANAAAKAADEAKRAASAALIDALGAGKRATCEGTPIATLSTGKGAPSLRPNPTTAKAA